MKLELDGTPKNVEGIFYFDNEGKRGSYRVHGRFRDDSFVLNPQGWIEQPSGFKTVRIEGKLDARSDEIRGLMTPCAWMGDFKAKRGTPGPIADPVTPPHKLVGIGGLLGAAKTAEEQCSVMEAWLKPYAPDVETLKRSTIDESVRKLIPAFEDENFEPVFGEQLLYTDQAQRTSVAALVRRYCRDDNFYAANIAVSYVLGSEIALNKFIELREKAAGTSDWLTAFRQRIGEVSDEQDSSRMLSDMRSELSRRRNDLSRDDFQTLQAALDSREQEVRISSVRKAIEDIPDDSFENGGLNTVFSILSRVDSKKLDRNLVQSLTAAAETKAQRILAPILNQARDVAANLPQTLEGLAMGEDFIRPLYAHQENMDRWFGTMDRAGHLLPLSKKIREMRNDPKIVAEFRDLILAAAQGPNGESEVKALAVKYFGHHPTWQGSDFSLAYQEALSLAEVSAVSVDDASIQNDPNEPSANHIAAAVLDRVKTYNKSIASMEAKCLSGPRSLTPTEAMTCLTMPVTFTGRAGVQAKLRQVKKIGCRTIVSGTQFYCNYQQAIDIVVPGFEGHSTINWAEALIKSGLENAMFRRTVGGWNVEWDPHG